MEGHELWHIVVLAATLFGAAGGLLLALSPLLFGRVPPGLERARPVLLGLLVGAVCLLILEWTAVH